MSLVIIWFILYCIGYFLCNYSYDNISFANGKVENMSSPKASDLRSDTDIHTVDAYVNQVVIPLKDFADYERTISRLTSDSTATSFIQLFIEGVPFALCIKSLQHFFKSIPSLDLPSFLCWLFAIIAVILCFGIVRYTIKKLYTIFLKIPAFQLSPDNLEEQFNQSSTEFPITRRKAFENYVISAYIAYYEQHLPSLQIRHRIATIVHCILSIIYLIFFFRAP